MKRQVRKSVGKPAKPTNPPAQPKLGDKPRWRGGLCRSGAPPDAEVLDAQMKVVTIPRAVHGMLWLYPLAPWTRRHHGPMSLTFDWIINPSGARARCWAAKPPGAPGPPGA